MHFGPVPPQAAAGAILAHALAAGGRALPKGHRLSEADIAALLAAGVEAVVVARPETGDIDENVAAAILGQAVAGEGIRADRATTGRVNLRAAADGLLEVTEEAVRALNAISPDVTLATLPPWRRVGAGQLVATAKIIPFFVPERQLRAAAAAGQGALRLRAFRGGTAVLVQTIVPGQKETLLAKGRAVTEARLRPLGYRLARAVACPHRTETLAGVLETLVREGAGDILLVLTGAATMDRRDVGPGAIAQAGGELLRFGMPVDPGNLLFLGRLGGRMVIGLPGCARSPARNGADLVLERVAAGIVPSPEDFAAMAVGGLLKEIPERGRPRESGGPSSSL